VTLIWNFYNLADVRRVISRLLWSTGAFVVEQNKKSRKQVGRVHVYTHSNSGAGGGAPPPPPVWVQGLDNSYAHLCVALVGVQVGQILEWMHNCYSGSASLTY
jgi:hypothetical protein